MANFHRLKMLMLDTQNRFNSFVTRPVLRVLPMIYFMRQTVIPEVPLDHVYSLPPGNMVEWYTRFSSTHTNEGTSI